MNLNQVFELSAVLDNEHFQKVFARSYDGEDYIDGDSGEYIDRSLSGKGITVIYRDSQYKKKIQVIVNTNLLVDDVSNIDRLIRKLDKRIIEYFNGKYRIGDFVLSGMNFVADMDVGTRANAMAYLKVLKRIGRVKGFSPSSYEYFDDNASFCLSGNSNDIEFLLYDLERAFIRQHKSANVDWKKLKPIKGILRAEVRLLVLIPEKKSLRLAQKAMNCRNIEKIMDSLAKINLSPVTISKRHDVKYLECFYVYLLDGDEK